MRSADSPFTSQHTECYRLAPRRRSPVRRNKSCLIRPINNKSANYQSNPNLIDRHNCRHNTHNKHDRYQNFKSDFRFVNYVSFHCLKVEIVYTHCWQRLAKCSCGFRNSFTVHVAELKLDIKNLFETTELAIAFSFCCAPCLSGLISIIVIIFSLSGLFRHKIIFE